MPVPEQVPISDSFHGVLLQAGDTQILAQQPEMDAVVIASGEFTIRYGLRFLGKLHQSIVPGLLVMDYGEMLTGEAAWDFLLKHSNLHPRAEIVGYRNDGKDDMVFLRALDLAVTPEVLVYNKDTDVVPLARPIALIAGETTGLPTRLLTYLPTFSTLADWHLNDS